MNTNSNGGCTQKLVFNVHLKITDIQKKNKTNSINLHPQHKFLSLNDYELHLLTKSESRKYVLNHT